jgi:hypothetical protein
MQNRRGSRETRKTASNDLHLWFEIVFNYTLTTSLYWFLAFGDSSGDETKQQKNDDKNPFLFFFFSVKEIKIKLETNICINKLDY